MVARSFFRTLVVLALMVAALAMPASSHADGHTADIFGRNESNYARFNANYCAPTMVCAAIFRPSAPAYYRTSTGQWATRHLAHDAVLYAYPFTYPYANDTGWHWAYSYADRRTFAIPTRQLTHFYR